MRISGSPRLGYCEIGNGTHHIRPWIKAELYDGPMLATSTPARLAGVLGDHCRDAYMPGCSPSLTKSSNDLPMTAFGTVLTIRQQGILIPGDRFVLGDF
jgi:hypothetical protein